MATLDNPLRPQHMNVLLLFHNDKQEQSKIAKESHSRQPGSG
jgi:hypothetical protein